MLRNRFGYILKLTRPIFLLGGVILYLLGAGAAFADGIDLNMTRLITGQLLVTSVQLMTHYSNEYYDLDTDRINHARTWFSGGSGVLVSGALALAFCRRAMLFAAGAAMVMLVIAGLQVTAVFFIGALALALAWSYSGPPLKLAGSGAGELSASIVVTLLVPVTGYVMQSGGPVGQNLLVICLPLFLIHYAMLIAFQIPDIPADRAAGKRTLAVRIGLERAAFLHNLILMLALMSTAVLILARWPGSQLTWLALPLGIWQAFLIRRLLNVPQRRYLWLTMGAIGLFGFSAALWLAGLIIQWNWI